MTINNSKSLTDSEVAALRSVKNSPNRLTRPEVINLCAKLGMYSWNTAETLLKGQVPESTLTKAERLQLEQRDRDEQYRRESILATVTEKMLSS